MSVDLKELKSFVQKSFFHYQECVNKIDDYFEYAFDSEKDKKAVMRFIDELASGIEKENEGYMEKLESFKGDSNEG